MADDVCVERDVPIPQFISHPLCRLDALLADDLAADISANNSVSGWLEVGVLTAILILR